jgi:hypothetical protein
MRTGCLLLLLTFAGTAVAEWVYFPEHLATHRWPGTLLLAFLVMLTAAAIGSLGSWFVRLRLGRKSPQLWRDGEFVAVSGELRPLREPLRAPASQTEAVIYNFQVYRPAETGTKSFTPESRKARVDAGSLGMAPCAVYTQSGAVRLVGLPTLVRFPQQSYEGDKERRSAALHMASQEWRRGEAFSLLAVEEALRMYATDAPAAQQNYMNPYCQLPLVVAPDSGEGSNASRPRRDPAEIEDLAARIHRLLKQQRARLDETVVEPGTVVTAFGHYSASVGAVDVGDGLRQWKRLLEPGDFQRVSAQALRRALAGIAIFGTLMVLAHKSVYFGEARWLLWLAEVFGD